MREQEVLNAFHNYYKEFVYDTVEIRFTFALGGSYDVEVYYCHQGNKKETSLDGKELFVYEHFIYETFKNRIDTNDKFNLVVFQIENNGQYSGAYKWDSDKAKKNLLDYAEIFYQLVNQRMMSLIFEYEKENNLVIYFNNWVKLAANKLIN